MCQINLVVSYPNPDTDGVACSIAMARLLSTESEKWYAVILGSIGEETYFVLKHLKIQPPNGIETFEGVEKIVLVDTHHKSQLPTDFPFDRVLFIIDHHPNGDCDAFPFASITNEKVGAAASIVAKMYFERNIIDKSMISLLGFAIISNTLNFSAPSTSHFDKDIYKQISVIYPIHNSLIDGMFEQRNSVFERDMCSALLSDFKIYDTKCGKIGISQIEAYNLERLIDIRHTVEALKQISIDTDTNLCLFNGVDIKTKRSIVLAANNDSEELACSIFKVAEYIEPLVFDRILLRKTDYIPQLNTL